MTTADKALGEYVYCKQHCRVHLTGWCTVHNTQKVSLKAITHESAIAEAIALGLMSNYKYYWQLSTTVSDSRKTTANRIIITFRLMVPGIGMRQTWSPGIPEGGFASMDPEVPVKVMGIIRALVPSVNLDLYTTWRTGTDWWGNVLTGDLSFPEGTSMKVRRSMEAKIRTAVEKFFNSGETTDAYHASGEFRCL